MPYPNRPDKSQGAPIYSAGDLLASLGAGPIAGGSQAAILLFQRLPLERLGRRLRPLRSQWLPGELYLAKNGPASVIVATRFGAGAPAAVVLLEMLAALGVRRLIALGLAGGLQTPLQSGDLVVCQRAIRDEGASYHYLPPEKYASAAPELVTQLEDALRASALSYQSGTSWTTDAPFRETIEEVLEYQSEGVLTVEMEAAALFAAGQRLGLQVAAAFAIGDRLRYGAGEPSPRWQLDFDKRQAQAGLQALFSAALRALGVVI